MAHQGSPGADRLLAAARAQFESLSATAAAAAVEQGALLVDIRPTEYRRANGAIPGAVVVERNVLEWRLDPAGEWRLPELTGPGQQVILCCNEGYATILAVPVLRELGLAQATDIEGGFQAWLDAGLPVDPA